MAKNKKSDGSVPNNDGLQEKITREESGAFDDHQQETIKMPESAAERKEQTEDDALRQKVRQEIEALDLEDSAAQQAHTTAKDMAGLPSEEKIKKLLEITAQKGVVYAVNVAKKMDDPYILDAFHDLLAKGGHYKKFIK